MIKNAISIKGFMSVEELMWLAERAAESSKIVEIGTYYGRSARALADSTKGEVFCIDPYPGQMLHNTGTISFSSGEYVYRQCLKNLGDHIDSGKVTLLRGTAEDFEDVIQDADFVFIDGNHLEAPCRKDIDFALRMVEKGIIAGHDYYENDKDWPDVKKVVNELFPNAEKGIGSLWWTRK